jgi:hypothetical protein
MTKAPVLFIAFARPEYATVTFAAIRKARPATLFFYSNIARRDNPDEIRRNNEVRSLVNEVDWDCELKIFFREDYVAPGISVSSAITWAFESAERLIIIEEDCIPALTFFSYCDVLLEKYKDDSRICMISGNNYSEDYNATEDSYFFSLYGHIWGWATWKRAWNKFDYEMKDWPLFKSSNQIQNVFQRKNERWFFLNLFDRYYLKEDKGTWDYQWFFCRIKEVGLSIVPKNNLVTNIGVQGVHSDTENNAHFIPVNENFTITIEPRFILRNTFYDKHHFDLVMNNRQNIAGRVINRLAKLLKRIFAQN